MMPEFDLFLMHPLSSFHIGERGVGMETTSRIIHSDTLFGAICWSWRLLHGEDELSDLLSRFTSGRPPFLISSAFPFIGEMYLMPRPLGAAKGIESDKKARRAWLVSHSVFQRIASGEDLTDYRVMAGGAVVSPEEALGAEDLLGASSPWTTAELPRVCLDRLTMRSGIYHVGELRFADGCGLYMIADFADRSIKNRLEGALRLLGDEGIGGERSCGKGLFSLERRSIRVGSDGGDKAVLLSLCRPGRDEVQALSSASYDLVLRRGWAGASSHRKRGLRMLSEGSVVPRSVSGSIAEVVNLGNKRVYSYGLALKAGMRGSG
ncbi:MAG: type III-A CRISPR-associated RAMP protein Csm4 [Methanothrix sp.]|nr:type III-A CRISPR-associated RAMP protein Csm4 [Methanothrix sp.]MCX8207800.1 type III-A CRISPR-associated RAMP protein Csm4 [Methanothrix sp.]